jgi:hypothetical protein
MHLVIRREIGSEAQADNQLLYKKIGLIKVIGKE